MDFFSWDDEWGDAAGGFEQPTQPVETNMGFDQTVEAQPMYEEPQPVETAPVQHIDETNDWYAGDEWGNYPTQPEPEPVVVQPPVREAVPEPVPEPVVVAPPPKTNSWIDKESTSLFTTPTTTKQPKQQPKQKKAVKQPVKQKQKQEKKRQPMKNVAKAAPKKPAQSVVPASRGNSSVMAENQSLRKEVSDLRGLLEQMDKRLQYLEHSKQLLYNSVCTLNSSGKTFDGRVCWTNEYGGDILPAQPLAYDLTEDGTGVTIKMDGLYEITFNSYGSEPKIQINNETYATGHTNNSSCYLSICVYVAERPVITCHVDNPVEGNACDHWLCIRRFPS